MSRMGSSNQNEAIKTWRFFFFLFFFLQKKVRTATISPSTASPEKQSDTKRAIPAVSLQLTSSLLINEANREAVLWMGLHSTPTHLPDRLQNGFLSVA